MSQHSALVNSIGDANENWREALQEDITLLEAASRGTPLPPRLHGFLRSPETDRGFKELVRHNQYLSRIQPTSPAWLRRKLTGVLKVVKGNFDFAHRNLLNFQAMSVLQSWTPDRWRDSLDGMRERLIRNASGIWKWLGKQDGYLSSIKCVYLCRGFILASLLGSLGPFVCMLHVALKLMDALRGRIADLTQEDLSDFLGAVGKKFKEWIDQGEELIVTLTSFPEQCTVK